jgi:hypothetical protein
VRRRDYSTPRRTRTHPSKGGHRSALPYSRSRNRCKAASRAGGNCLESNPLDSCPVKVSVLQEIEPPEDEG